MDLYLLAGPFGTAAEQVPQAAFLCFDWAAFSSLERRGLEAAAWEDYFPAESVPELLAASERAARAWPLADGVDFTSWQGISLGKTYRWLFWMFTVLPAFKFLTALRAAVAKHRPMTVYCDDRVPRVFRDVLERLAEGDGGFRVVKIAGRGTAPSILSWSVPRVTLSPAKALAARFFNGLAALGRARAAARPTALISNYTTLEPVIDLLSRGSGFRCLMVDAPRRKHLLGLLRQGGEIVVEPRTPPAFSGAQRKELAKIRAAWTRAAADPAYRALYAAGGVDLWPVVRPALEEFFGGLLEPLAWACDSYQRLWRLQAPAFVLMAYNEAPLQHLLSEIARAHGTPAVTILHGLPQGERLQFGENNTSRFFVWGEEQRRIFERTDSLKCECSVSGNPHFDRYASLPPPPPARGPIRKILVLTNPVGHVIELSSNLDPERYATGIARILEGFDDFQTTFKIHPSESLPYYESLLTGSRAKLAVIKDRAIEDCLAEADLVIGPFSTVLIQAMILGKPLLCVNLTRAAYQPPFNDAWGIRTLKSEAELRAALSAAVADPDGTRSSLLAPCARVLAEFVGPLDGASARRALSLLARLEKPAKT